jgi:prepilin-type N-terminal cleavage/methylation domain-containing protein
MKKAFTMMELIFVLVVMGIIAAVVIPNTRTNPLEEAAVQLASHIRYTQHLAMIDDKYNPNRLDTAGNVIWFKDRWQIAFGNNNQYADYKPAYTIFSDSVGNAVSRGDAQEEEIAKNPENPNQIMTGGYNSTAAVNYGSAGFKGMKKLNIGNAYRIASITLSGGCSGGSRISFDHLGRPMKGDQSTMTGPYSAGTQRLITQDCNVVLKDFNDNNITIIVTPETGYVKINF